MKKIDLTNVQEFTSFRRPVGGFVLKIISVEDVADKEYLKVFYDIAQAHNPEDAEFVGMYTKRKKERGFDFPSTVVSYKETAKPMFKGFTEALKKSNNGYDFTQTFDEAELAGKVFGAVLGDEEYMGKDKNGAPKVKVRTTVVARRSVQSILDGDYKVPELKKLEQTATATPTNPFQQAVQSNVTEPPTMNTQAPVQQNPFAEVPQQTETPTQQTFDADEIPF